MLSENPGITILIWRFEGRRLLANRHRTHMCDYSPCSISRPPRLALTQCTGKAEKSCGACTCMIGSRGAELAPRHTGVTETARVPFAPPFIWETSYAPSRAQRECPPLLTGGDENERTIRGDGETHGAARLGVCGAREGISQPCAVTGEAEPEGAPRAARV